MKQPPILIAFALALSLGWMGCNKSGKLAESSTSAPPSGRVELKLKWPQGERIVQDMEMKQSMELTMPGRPGPVKQEGSMGQEFGLTVLQETPGGGHEVEMAFLSARLGATREGKSPLVYDSSKKETMLKGDPVAGLIEKILASKIRFFLNASNEVERLEGAQELANQISSSATTDQIALLNDIYSEASLRQMMSQARSLPPKPVQPGDTWPAQYEFPGDKIGTLVVDLNFTFQRWETHGKRTCARLEFEGTIKTKPGSDSAPPGMSVSDLQGYVSGVSWFDPELGLKIDTSMTQDLGMVIHVPTKPRGGAADQMVSITNQMNQVTTITLASVK